MKKIHFRSSPRPLWIIYKGHDELQISADDGSDDHKAEVKFASRRRYFAVWHIKCNQTQSSKLVSKILEPVKFFSWYLPSLWTLQWLRRGRQVSSVKNKKLFSVLTTLRIVQTWAMAFISLRSRPSKTGNSGWN